MAMKILFAFYPLYVSYNHGIAVLSTACKLSGVETDLYLLDNVQSFTDYIDSHDFHYIAFSCVTKHDYNLSVPFMIEATKRGVTTILGGVYPRLPIVLYSYTTLICRGEGELLPLFLTKEYTGLFQEPQRCIDLNKLPLPDYELFIDIPYDRDLPFKDYGKILPYSSSRGCPYKCNFCAVSVQPSGVRIRTNVENDLMLLTEEYNPGIIHFLDELVPYYSEAWKESWGNFHFPFIAYIRGDIKQSQLIWLKDRGMVGCFFGVESGNEVYRNTVLNKQLSNAQILNTVAVLKEMDMPYMVSYMRGTPEETWEMQSETVQFMRTVGGFPTIYNYESLV
jgi:radical SAM superfamily enzyme YgiQ (UPF0313 family)